MEFRADLVDGTSGPAQAGANGLRKYKTAIDATSEALERLQKTTGNTAPLPVPSAATGGSDGTKAAAARVAAEAKAAAQIAAIAEKGAQARATADAKAAAQSAAIAEKGAQARATAELKAVASIQLAREKMAAADNAQRNKAMSSLIIAQSKAKTGGGAERSGKPGGVGASGGAGGGASAAAAMAGVETKDFTFMKATKAAADAAALKGKQSATEAYYAKVRGLEGSSSTASATGSEKKAAAVKALGSSAIATAKGIALAGGAALGAGGAMGLARMAMGYKGMMQLQGITFRAGIAFRGLFKGVDSSPIIRAATAFTSQFSKSTVTGQALAGLFTRGFNGLFSLVEKATPYVTAFTQGIVLGFLYAENAILKARIALMPYSGVLDGIVSSTTMLKVAAIGGGLALGIAAAYAVAAAAPFIALGAAITAVAAAFEQASKLSKEWDENSGGQIWTQVKSDIGWDSAKDNKAATAKRQGMVTGADYDKLYGGDKAKPGASTGGVEAGAALGAGMVKGMAASEAAVAAGGAAMAKAAIKGAKTEAEIKSPSRKTRREVGRELGAGVEKGLDDSGPGVQAAAEKNLVPSIGGASAGAGGGRPSGGAMPPIQIGPFIFPELRSGAREDIEAAIEAATPRIVDAVTRFIAIQLGISTEATT